MKIYLTSSCSAFSFLIPNTCRYTTSLFSNGEIQIEIEKSLEQCCIITSVTNHDEFVELLLLINALKTTNVVLIILYLFYSRQDDISHDKSIGAQLIQSIIEQQKNVKKIFLLDPHSNFFTKNSYEISAFDLFKNDIQRTYFDDYVIVAPDLGISNKAMKLANVLNVPLIQCQKDRSNGMHITIPKVNLKKNCILVDDIVDSGATICNAATALIEHGANSIICYCTHGVLSAGAGELIMKSPISELMITDSILQRKSDICKVRRITLLPLLRQVIDGML